MLFHTSALRAELFMLHFSVAESWCSYVHQTFAAAEQATLCSEGQAGGQTVSHVQQKGREGQRTVLFSSPVLSGKGW